MTAPRTTTHAAGATKAPGPRVGAAPGQAMRRSQAADERGAVLLSILPRWAEMILDGRKTVEIRRRSPGVRRGDVVALYASGTRRAVIGSARVRRVERVATDLVWGHLRGRGGIDKPALEDYLRGCARACLIELEAPRAGSAEVRLSQLRRAAPGFHPPQSARRLRPALAADRAVLDLLGLPMD